MGFLGKQKLENRNDRFEVMLDDCCAEKSFFASVNVSVLRKKEKSLNSENRNKINVLHYDSLF